MIGKQQAISVDPKAIQQINFTANLNLTGDTYMMRIPKKLKDFFYFLFFTRIFKSIVNTTTKLL